MDLFERRNIDPMLIAQQTDPFDDERYLYEVKFDGLRCLAYLGDGVTDLRNKRHRALIEQFPELANIHENMAGRCILDGELVVMIDGTPNFEMVQARSITTNQMKISAKSREYPATYVAYDILYSNGDELINKPLDERKEMLSWLTRNQDDRFALSTVFDSGTILFEMTGKMGLEGVVAKRRDSLYKPSKRSKDWIKFKHYEDKDFVIAGYLRRSGDLSLVLGLYDDGVLIRSGYVSLGVNYSKIRELPTTHICPFKGITKGDTSTIWFNPLPVGVVKYMYRADSGGMRQPVFVGFRDDMLPTDCIMK